MDGEKIIVDLGQSSAPGGRETPNPDLAPMQSQRDDFLLKQRPQSQFYPHRPHLNNQAGEVMGVAERNAFNTYQTQKRES